MPAGAGAPVSICCPIKPIPEIGGVRIGEYKIAAEVSGRGADIGPLQKIRAGLDRVNGRHASGAEQFEGFIGSTAARKPRAGCHTAEIPHERHVMLAGGRSMQDVSRAPD